MSLLWSAQQREWLQALGHPVLVLAGADDSAPPQVPDPVGQPPASPPQPSSPPPRPARRIAPVVEAPAVTDAPAPSAPAAADRRLHRALLRATGQRTTRAAEQALAGLDVDLAALRGDPAAKRALWPRLRALHDRRRP